MKRDLLAALASAGAVALTAVAAVAVSNHMGGRPDETPVVVQVRPVEPHPGVPVPQRPGYPIERWHKLQEASK